MSKLILVLLAYDVRAFLPSFHYTRNTRGPMHCRDSKSLVEPQRSLRSSKSENDHLIRFSNSLRSDKLDRIETEAAHLHHQKQVFDGMASTFALGVAEDLIPAYRRIAKTVVGTATGDLRILDVACGSGALWPFMLKERVPGLKLDVIGVDLSGEMVAAATTLGNTLGMKQELATFQAVESDIKSFCDKQGHDTFHVAVVNACFGNFWDPFDVLSVLAKVTSDTIVVSHPLGAEFVEKLHKQDRQTVPNLLPTTTLAWQSAIAIRRIPLRVKQLMLDFNGDPFYLACFQKTRAKALEMILRLSGNVDRGYGRGGKKLGFPTANLPSRLFQGALERVQPGVYFGWAMVGGRLYKAVVNVGFSPTFVGQENPEKIVEAHLILDKEVLGDFYDQPMLLLLLGFLRSEMKFQSFPDLVSQINADVADSKDILDDELYQEFRSDKMFASPDWMGSSGSNKNASWEFQPFAEAML